MDVIGNSVCGCNALGHTTMQQPPSRLFMFTLVKKRRTIRFGDILRMTGVREAEVRVVEGTNEETKGSVVCGPGIS